MLSGSVLHEALEARSYKGELILIANSLEKIGGIVQLISNLGNLGYGHVLLLSYDRSNCEGLLGLLPGMGCVWSSFSFGDSKDIPEHRFLLWFLRCTVCYIHAKHPASRKLTTHLLNFSLSNLGTGHWLGQCALVTTSF